MSYNGWRKKRKKSSLTWNDKGATQNFTQDRYQMAQKAILDAMVLVFSSWASIWMFNDLFTHSHQIAEVNISMKAVGWIIMWSVLLFVFRNILDKKLQKATYHLIGNLSLCATIGFGWIWYYEEHAQSIQAGMNGLATAGVRWINAYYKMHLEEFGGENLAEISYAAEFSFIALFFLQSYFVIFFQSRFYYLVTPGLILLFSMGVGYAPGINGLCAFGAAILLSKTGGWAARKVSVAPKQKQKGMGIHTFAPLVVVVILGILCGIVGKIFLSPLAEEVVDNGESVIAFQDTMEKRMGQILSPKMHKKENGEVTNKEPEYEHKEVFSLTLDTSPYDPIYLRGSYGVTYENGVWKDDEIEFADFCKTNGYEEPVMAQCSARLGASTVQQDIFMETGGFRYERADMWIEYTGLSPDVSYFPYFLKNADSYDLSKNAQMKAPGLREEQSFSYWKSWAGINHLSNYLNMKVRDDMYDTDRDVYAAYVESVCGKKESTVSCIPSIAKKIKKEVFAKEFGWEGNEKRIKFAKFVQSYLSGATYNTQLTDNGQEDPVSYFLTESHEGFCVHFASAGVLLLQEMGVPARYVSGYRVDVSEFEPLEDGFYQASVQDDDAHAWAEIFLEGIGWIPVEMVQNEPIDADGTDLSRLITGKIDESEEIMEHQTTDNSLEIEKAQKTESHKNNNPIHEETAEKENTAEQQQERGESDQEFNHTSMFSPKSEDSFSWLVPLLAILMGFGLFGVFLRWYFLRKNALFFRSINRKKARDAVHQIHRKLYRRVRQKNHIRYRRLNDKELLEVLQKTYPQIPAKTWEKYMELARRAQYSTDVMKSEEVAFVYQIYRKTQNRKSRDGKHNS